MSSWTLFIISLSFPKINTNAITNTYCLNMEHVYPITSIHKYKYKHKHLYIVLTWNLFIISSQFTKNKYKCKYKYQYILCKHVYCITSIHKTTYNANINKNKNTYCVNMEQIFCITSIHKKQIRMKIKNKYKYILCKHGTQI